MNIFCMFLTKVLYLRSALHVHGSDLGQNPTHSLQRGVVVGKLHAAAHEVLLLKDDHAAALVGLEEKKEEQHGEECLRLGDCLAF